MAKRYDMGYDQTMLPAKQRSVNEFLAGGPTSPAGVMTAGNTSLLHLGELDDVVDKLRGQKGMFAGAMDYFGGMGIPFVSHAAEQLKNAGLAGTKEGTDLASFLTARQRFTEEVTKFYSGSAGAEGERLRAIELLDAAKTPEELHHAIATDLRMIRDRVEQYQHRFMAGMLPQAWKEAVRKDPTIVTTYQNSREVLDRVLKADDEREAARKSGAAAPAPVAAPAAAPGATPAPTEIPANYREWGKKSPANREQFIKKFGVEP
jgi:hypothetical protein